MDIRDIHYIGDEKMMRKIWIMGLIAVSIILMASAVMAATGTIQIKDANGGIVKVINIDSNDVVCNSGEEVNFRYCPPQLDENDPAIDRLVVIGHVDHGK